MFITNTFYEAAVGQPAFTRLCNSRLSQLSFTRHFTSFKRSCCNYNSFFTHIGIRVTKIRVRPCLSNLRQICLLGYSA
ncbi:Uncharacterised protein [Vibrio cholerae]|nr:Uncharacterised protein [Vibrio cholerae]